MVCDSGGGTRLGLLLGLGREVQGRLCTTVSRTTCSTCAARCEDLLGKTLEEKLLKTDGDPAAILSMNKELQAKEGLSMGLYPPCPCAYSAFWWWIPSSALAFRMCLPTTGSEHVLRVQLALRELVVYSPIVRLTSERR